jgi:hypothetical protein
MYIHLIKINELPENVYKIIYTDIDAEKIETMHKMFYKIDNVFTYNIANVDQKIILNGMELFKMYKMKSFIHCYDLEKFEQMWKTVEQMDDCLDYINIEPSSLKLTKLESAKIYDILKYFINVSEKKNLFMSNSSLKNLKNFDENIHKIYLDDNSTIVCQQNDIELNSVNVGNSISPIDHEKVWWAYCQPPFQLKHISHENNIQSNVIQQNDIQHIEENFFVTILDEHIYLSKSLDEFIELGNSNLKTDLLPEEMSTLLDSLNGVEPIKILNDAQISLRNDTNGKNGMCNIYTTVDEKNSVEPYNSGDENVESVVSNYSHNYYSNNKIGLTLEEIEKEREKELTEPTTLKTVDENVNYESTIVENEEKIIEEMIESINNVQSGLLLFIKNNILEKNLIITELEKIKCVKESTIFPEMEYIIEYIIPDIEQVSKLLDIKLKNVETLTLDIIDKNIMKINEFLYGDDKRSIITNSDKYSHMLSLVRDFMIKNCIRKRDSKVYSTQLYSKFYENLLLTTPSESVYFNKNNFTPLVKKMNYQTKRDSNGVYWIDLELKYSANDYMLGRLPTYLKKSTF